jgi:putative ABC transport system substrate-binding protein
MLLWQTKGDRMNRRDTILALLVLGTVPAATEAQQARIYRVGVLWVGGAASASIDGLRDGLRELGLDEGKQVIFHLRDSNGDLKSVDASAKRLEGERVDVIYTVSTSVTLAAQRATKSVPIVFYAGSDPVKVGIVESYRKPGGRLTGIHSLTADLMAKRLQLLKEMIPRLQRVATFYNPENPASQQSMKIVREASQRLNVELVQRQVTSVEQLRAALGTLRPTEADAILSVPDSMVSSQPELIIRAAREKKLPTMFQFSDDVAKGAMASYGVSYYDLGRLSAKHVQRILTGSAPGELPVEQIDRFSFIVNLKTAKELGVTIPQSMLLRADKVIE